MASGCLGLILLLGGGVLGPFGLLVLLFLGVSTSVAVPPPVAMPTAIISPVLEATPTMTEVPLMSTLEATEAAESNAASGANFTPLTRTIWNAEPGKDRTEGICGEAMVNYCAYMAALTPQGEDLLFKGMEIQPYLLTKIDANRYAYTGRNMIGDGEIELTLTFTSAAAFTMDQVLVLDADPQCRHINTFSGTFMR
ncbi:MAG: hypothetical protein KF726_28190 [Anaerolineae bacterium]|nr:hypothetical protein [Anaerolineae bacterium]